jgi:hypothetical protein
MTGNNPVTYGGTVFQKVIKQNERFIKFLKSFACLL